MRESETFIFGPFSLSVDGRELRWRGELVELGSRAFDLLVALARRRGQLATKSELMEEVWPDTVVEENNLKVQVSALRKVLLKDPATAHSLRTIPGRGYRFLAASEADQSVDPSGRTEIRTPERSSLMEVPALSTDGTGAMPLLPPSKPSIAVLPFTNMSGDPEQEYFADGISEDIITGLSKLHWFFVIARNSSFTYKGKTVDVKRVAHELGVRYLLEGSVRKGGNRVRITAQLIDASTGNHIWAERYDGELTDIFALQDEITEKVVAAIEPKLVEAEGIRSQNRSPEELGAWDMVIQANSLFWRLTKVETEAATDILRQSVERYPSYGPAHSILAFVLLISGYVGWSDLERQLQEAARLAARAAQLDDGDPWAHLALGFVAFVRRQTKVAAAEFRRALELNPNFAAAHGYLGWTLAFDGQTDEATKHLEEAVRMSPHDPQNAIFNTGLAVTHYLTERYAKAVEYSSKSLQQRSAFTAGYRIHVASLAQNGQINEAREALARLKEMHPDLSIDWIEKNVPYTSAPMLKFVEGMRKAGLE